MRKAKRNWTNMIRITWKRVISTTRAVETFFELKLDPNLTH